MAVVETTSASFDDEISESLDEEELVETTSADSEVEEEFEVIEILI